VHSPSAAPKLEDVTVLAQIAAFYKREMPRLIAFGTAVSAGLDVHAAADVAQAAFERALPRWAGLRDPKAWLYRVARNEALARAKAVRREFPADVLPERPDAGRTALLAEMHEEQRVVLGHLMSLPRRSGRSWRGRSPDSRTPTSPMRSVWGVAAVRQGGTTRARAWLGGRARREGHHDDLAAPRAPKR
jgi:hypothetical protein